MSNPIVAVQCTKCTMRCEDERYFAITNLTPCNLNNCDGRMEFQFQEKFITEEEFYATEECITEDGKHSVVDGHCWNCCACDTCISRLEEKEEEDKTCWTCKKEYEVEPGRGSYDGHQCWDCYVIENGAD